MSYFKIDTYKKEKLFLESNICWQHKYFKSNCMTNFAAYLLPRMWLSIQRYRFIYMKIYKVVSNFLHFCLTMIMVIIYLLLLFRLSIIASIHAFLWSTKKEFLLESLMMWYQKRSNIDIIHSRHNLTSHSLKRIIPNEHYMQ